MKKNKELDSISLSFVLRKKGEWTEKAQTDFADRMQQKGLAASNSEAVASLERARELFHDGNAHLFVCSDASCKKRYLNLKKKKRKRLEKKFGLHISQTACQGPCKKAPTATLRIGGQCEQLFDLRRKKDLKAIAKRAQKGNSANKE